MIGFIKNSTPEVNNTLKIVLESPNFNEFGILSKEYDSFRECDAYLDCCGELVDDEILLELKMKLLYYVQRKGTIQNNLPLPNLAIPTITRLSSLNVMAFVTPNDLIENKYAAWSSYVYVCDITCPWNIFKVTSSKQNITVLEWSVSGRYLLICDASGEIQIWTQKDNLLSEWFQIAQTVVPSEKIMYASFFQNSRKIIFSPEKRDVVYYTDKFQRVQKSPSVRNFGGSAAEGCIAITTSGLIASFLIPPRLISSATANTNNNNNTYPLQLTLVTHSLELARNHILCASITGGKSLSYNEESFRIAVVYDDTPLRCSNMVYCYRVVIKIIDDNLTITSTALPHFIIFEGAARDLTDIRVTHVKWAKLDEGNSLIIGAKSNAGCFIELWNLKEKATPIHKLFQASKTEVYKSIAWMSCGITRVSSPIIDFCVTKLNFDGFNVFVITSDDNLYVFGKDLKKITTVSLSNLNIVEKEINNKKPRMNIHMMSLDVTYFGHLLFTVDVQGQIYVFKIPQTYYDLCGSQISVTSYITSLIEYSIVTGYDPVDIFITIRPNTLEQVIDKLTENFTRQPSNVQQYFYVKFLTTKINLYRLSLSGQTKANDLTCLLMLHSILIAFKSLLRPADLASHDKGPAENLALVLSESVPDVDKVLLNLDAKDFTVEPSTLQSLQQLIQWVSDLALNILAKLPQNQMNQSKNVGYEISKDIVALNSIRELLVMIRIWGLVNTQCLPIFSRSVENLDILATLFRLLTRLALNPTEPDDQLLDECCLLPSQVLIPQLQFVTTSNTSITSPVFHLNSFPLPLVYHIEPEALKFWKDYSLIDGAYINDGMVDSIRNLLLGKKPYAVRRCIRCGSLSNVNSVAKTAAMKAWEQRFAACCRCRGFWILRKN